MANYNTVPAAEVNVQKPKPLKQIIVAAAVTSFVLGAVCAEITSYSAQIGATDLVAGPQGGQPFVVPNKPGLYNQCEYEGDDHVALGPGQSASAVSPSSVKIGGLCDGATVTITGGVGPGGVTLEGPMSNGASLVINGDVAGDLEVISVSTATITVTGAVRGVIKFFSLASNGKIEAGSCPGGIVRGHADSSGQIICAGQVRVGA